MIKILYFSRIKEALGCGEEKFELDSTMKTAKDLLLALRRRGEPWNSVFDAEQVLLVAINQEIADPGADIRDGDEVAFFPPVTGG